MGVEGWLRRLFRSADSEAEAAEREDFGAGDAGEAELEGPRLSGRTFEGAEGSEAARADLDELEAPPDPAP